MNILGSGRLVVLDSAYVTKILFEDAKAVWNLRMIATLHPNTAHLPCNFSALKSRASRWIRGYSETVHYGSLNITFWNDSNSVSFLDNDLISSRNTSEQIETQSGPDNMITFAPHMQQQFTAKTMAILTDQIKLDHTTRWTVRLSASKTVFCLTPLRCTG